MIIAKKKLLATLFLLTWFGTAQATTASEQAEIPVLRPFYETRFDQAGISVHVPARPEWSFAVVRNNTGATVELRTPINYYPPAVIQITRNSHHGSSLDDLPAVALSAINQARELSVVPRLDSESDLLPFRSGYLSGYQDQYTLTTDEGAFDVHNVVAVFPSGHLLTVLVSTPEGQIDHIEHMVAKILRNLKEL